MIPNFLLITPKENSCFFDDIYSPPPSGRIAFGGKIRKICRQFSAYPSARSYI